MIDPNLMPKAMHGYLALVACMGLYCKPTGSRVTKSGFTKDSDFDFVVYDPDKKLDEVLRSNKAFTLGGSGNGSEFQSFKSRINGEHTLNFILVDSKEVFNKYVAATEIIRTLDCKTKAERIKIFDTIFDRSVEALPF